MRRAAAGPLALAVALAATVAVAGCKDGEAPDQQVVVRRSGDAGPPVVIVDDTRQLGPTTPEVEPNDTPDAAGALALPGAVSGQLAEGDVDRYALTAAQAGVIALRLQPDEALDAILEIAGADGKPIARSDRGPGGALEGLPDLPVARGERYVVTVTRFVKPTRKKKPAKGKKAAAAADAGADAAAGPGYTLHAELVTPGDELEREPNDDVGGARELLLGDEAQGYLGWAKDVDVWKLSAAGFTADYALDLSIDGVEGVALTASLSDGSGPLVTRKGGKGEGVPVRGLVPRGSNLVLTLTGSSSHPEAAYRLRIASRGLEAIDEREPNDAEDGATPIALSPATEQGGARGHLDGGDRDLWRVSSTEPVMLSVWIAPPPGVDVALRAAAVGGRELARADVGKQSDGERLDEVAVAPGADVVIEVTGKGAADVADPYSLRWSFYPGTPAAPSPLEPEPSE